MRDKLSFDCEQHKMFGLRLFVALFIIKNKSFIGYVTKLKAQDVLWPP